MPFRVSSSHRRSPSSNNYQASDRHRTEKACSANTPLRLIEYSMMPPFLKVVLRLACSNTGTQAVEATVEVHGVTGGCRSIQLALRLTFLIEAH
jgi:hypothetical protein